MNLLPTLKLTNNSSNMPSKSDESACEIRMPALIKGSLEHFLKFLIAFKQVMTDMNLDNETMDACREFRTHTQDRALNQFNTKYEEM